LIKGVEPVVKSLSIVGAGSDLALPALSQSTFHKPANLREWDTKNQKQKTDMKKLIVKMLGLDTLVTAVLTLRKENEELKTKIENLETHISEMDVPNMDEWVLEDDINDRIESYLNDNDYATQSYCDDEIESKVSDAIDDADIDSKIESAIEDLDIDEKVRELLGDASPAKACEDAVRKQVIEAVKVTLEKMVKALADQQG
jgi:hypothetical protein